MTVAEKAAEDAAEQAHGAGMLTRGAAAIRASARNLSGAPGVYRMLDRRGGVLYVGKARNLKRRVSSYARTARLPTRLKRMVAETTSLEVVTTHTDAEALLLEANLIKRYKPHYNVLMRDDKSFPYIHVTAADEAPRIVKHRGPRTLPGNYFGPYASASAVTRTLDSLERAFLLRTCSDSIFRSRTRPCLKYQIKRCSAPCVGRVGKEDYALLVAQARDFLNGRSSEVQQALAEAMHAASAELAFERAAYYRDRIRALTAIQAHQTINLENTNIVDADVFAAHMEAGQVCVQAFFFRAGRNNGSRAYFPRHDRAMGEEEVLGAALAQLYESVPPPPLILSSHTVPDEPLLAEALTLAAGRRVQIRHPRRGPKAALVRHARDNAREALARRLAERRSQNRLLERAAEVFGLDQPPRRIETYDNSHIGGAHAIGAMVVAGPEGFRKNAYRKFNIRGAARPGEASGEGGFAAGDDYAMMREVLTRRFTRAQKDDPSRETDAWPDLVLIDGGVGQLNAALEVFADLGIDDPPVVAIAKGPDRNAGRERLMMAGRAPFSLEPRDPLLYYLQRLRDEAHRFAIGGHRARRAKAITTSPLDEIPGVGAKRKRALLDHFGSARAVGRAGLADLRAVEGISEAVAERIYGFFHDRA